MDNPINLYQIAIEHYNDRLQKAAQARLRRMAQEGHNKENLMQNRNHAILLSKSYYFIFFASALLPFLALYYEQLGLSGRQIGLLASIPFWMTVLSALLFLLARTYSYYSLLILRL